MVESPITNALEDYIETIYLLVRDNKLARVKDIAKARGVKMGSVTPAMKRLAEMDYISYEQREYIDLTPKGEQLARSIVARHDLLRRFFKEVLHMSDDAAEADACSMEHHLSDEGMDKLTRFFEFIGNCPDGNPSFIDRFHQCRAVQPDLNGYDSKCNDHICREHGSGHCKRHERRRATKSLADLQVGETGKIAQVKAKGAIRQRLLDMGMLPNTEITLERLAPSGDPVWVKMQGFQLSLRKNEAEAILVQG